MFRQATAYLPAQGHVAVKPRRGDGLLFWSTHPDGSTMDPASTHEGCPVLVGSKWTTTTWIHTKPFRPEEYNPSSNKYRVNPPFQDPGYCTDGSDQCPKWAAAGECERNSVFMKGGPLVVRRDCEKRYLTGNRLLDMFKLFRSPPSLITDGLTWLLPLAPLGRERSSIEGHRLSRWCEAVTLGGWTVIRSVFNLFLVLCQCACHAIHVVYLPQQQPPCPSLGPPFEPNH
ncbi:uncharacterized protein HaLaN_17019 [Haematococcus lacustris]|uniref:ShKT domain-containing protein n=1 Tax=Haematococcus lacustris TaxID=44745 RepID=A0A699ZM10_HAELA|nr:uncharacterized protein HaLaN_17019 [Haematococcus lacustris]